MRVSVVRPVIILMAFSILLTVTPLSTIAQGTPEAEASPPAPPTLRGDLPEDFCTVDEIKMGDEKIVERPQGGALVIPAATPGRDLYLVELTLPKDTCLGYGSHYLHDGAITWLVQSGKIEFAAQPIAGLPAATAYGYWTNGVSFEPSAKPTLIGPGDWVAIDRAAEYSYRNVGNEPAVVLMAVNEEAPLRGCRGGCPGRKG